MGYCCSCSDRRWKIDQLESAAFVPCVSTTTPDREITKSESCVGYDHQIVQRVVPCLIVYTTHCFLICYHWYGTIWRYGTLFFFLFFYYEYFF